MSLSPKESISHTKTLHYAWIARSIVFLPKPCTYYEHDLRSVSSLYMKECPTKVSFPNIASNVHFICTVPSTPLVALAIPSDMTELMKIELFTVPSLSSFAEGFVPYEWSVKHKILWRTASPNIDPAVPPSSFHEPLYIKRSQPTSQPARLHAMASSCFSNFYLFLLMPLLCPIFHIWDPGVDHNIPLL